MSDTFDINRFWLLARRQWAENRKVYLLLWSILSVIQVFLTIAFYGADYLVMLFFWLFWLGGCAVTATMFTRWPDKGHSSFFLLLPASAAEKFLYGVFYGLVYIPVFCLNFFIFRYIFTYLVFLPFPNNLGSFSSFFAEGIHGIISIPFSFYTFALLTFLFLQSVFFIIITTFRKRHALIFILLIPVTLIGYTLGMKFLMSGFGHLPPGTVFTPGILLPHFNLGFGYIGSKGGSSVSEYFYFIKTIRNLNNLIWIVIFFLLYLTAGYRLKEREN